MNAGRDEIIELLRQARDVSANAYAPYSKFKVGAAVLTENGRRFFGANVENAAFGECICAEKSALSAAVTAGEWRPVILAVVAADGRSVRPCGACRQVIYELNPGCLVATVGEQGEPDLRTAAELLPDPFELDK